MKKIFFSIIITFALAIAVILGITFFQQSDYVAKSRSSVEANEVWQVALASYVNEKKPEIQVDEDMLGPMAVKETYMNDSLGMMFSADGLREAFDCAIHLYEEAYYLIEKGEDTVILPLDADYMEKDGEVIALSRSTEIREDTVYIPADVVEKGFDYTYTWNTKELRAKFTRGAQTTDLPAYYNYAEKGRLPHVKDQESLGACWAFAALGAVETTLLPEEDADYSEDHMIFNSGFGLDPAEGGDYIMALAYLSSWKGPVYEEDDPYGDEMTDPSLTAVKHVQEVRMIESGDFENIKKMIFKYGGVESSVFIAFLDESTVDDRYYNEAAKAYCYPEKTDPNHEIVIVGWDDHYPAKNFGGNAHSDGAFICQNSWGTRFGDNGIFYVSYEDAVIGTCSEVYTKVEEPDNYDHIYQYDDCGWIGRVGYNRNRAFFANVYTADPSGNGEQLCAVSFYATGPDTSYKVYADTNIEENGELAAPKEVLAEGRFSETGYYTVPLSQPVPLSPGRKFAVVVEINTPGSSHPIAMEMNADDMRTGTVRTDGKESYISNNGTGWERTQETSGCNVCLKAFTKSR